MAKLSIKKGDNVMVITGKDKGKAGEVLNVNPISGRIVVSGVNMVSKHVKPRNAQQAGGIVKREGTIDVSNVMVICPNCHEVVRVNHQVVDGKKVRVCNKCHESLEVKKASVKKTAKKVAKKKAAKAADAE